MKLKDLTKEEAEAISKFLTEKLGVRECWHEFNSYSIMDECSFCECGADNLESPNPSILSADFREEVMGAWKQTKDDDALHWWLYENSGKDEYMTVEDGAELADTLTNKDKWVYMILKEMGYDNT